MYDIIHVMYITHTLYLQYNMTPRTAGEKKTGHPVVQVPPISLLTLPNHQAATAQMGT